MSLESLLNPSFSPRYLVLEDCASNLMYRVINRLDPDVSSGGPMLFPGLEEIIFVQTAGYRSLSGEVQNHAMDLYFGAVLMGMLERRRAASQTFLRFRVTFVGWIQVVWPGILVERMKEMRNQGFPLEVYEDGRPLEWL